MKSLLLCSDEKIIRVLRRVLIDLEIAMEHCARAEDAVHKLTRERFEAVIVDCDDLPSASVVLKSVRTAPCNKRAIAVGLIDGHFLRTGENQFPRGPCTDEARTAAQPAGSHPNPRDVSEYRTAPHYH